MYYSVTFQSGIVPVMQSMISVYILKSLTAMSSKNNPKLSRSFNRSSGITPNALQAIEVSIKCRVGVALIEAGPQIRLLYASTGFFRILGAGEGELAIPCSLEQIGIHPDYAADYEQILRKSVDKEGISDHIQRISRKRTDWIWRHVRVARVAYPGSRYPVLLELSTDISELIRKDRQLRESNERLRVAFRQTPHRMWEVDIDERTYNTFNID